MIDITSHRLIKLKGFLFLLVGLLASALVVVEHPTLEVAVLMAIAIWCFCRFYYFAFYVIEHYVDSNYRFSGLWSFARYWMRGRKKDRWSEKGGPPSPRPSPPRRGRPEL